MTRTQLQKQQAKVRREKLRERRKAGLVRAAIRKAKRKAKRVAKAAPKKSLAAWAMLVRDRAYNTCEMCGATADLKLDKHGNPLLDKRGNPIIVRLNAHHLLEKRYYPTLKCDPMNGVLLCPKCHSFGKYSAHKNAIYFVLFLKKHCSDRYNWCKEHL